MPRELLSDQNKVIKQIRRAISRGGLTDEGYAVAEGVHLLEEAQAARCEIGAVIAAESASAFHNFPQARVVSDKTFDSLSTTETPQGILALVRMPEWNIGRAVAGKALVLALDGIQDPGNAGAMIRAAEAFGATGAIFLKGSVNPYNPKCLRGSAGSLFRLPAISGIAETDFLEHVAKLKIYAAAPRGNVLLKDADLASPCTIVIGSEGRGVSQSIEERATGLRIPTDKVESLNAAVAAGVILYEAQRQRGQA